MAQMPPLQYGSRSPDGRWWWDGTAWQPVPPGSQPAPQPPAGYAPPAAPPAYGAPAAYGAYPYPAQVGQRVPGTPRSIGVSILLAIVTVGIYTFVWVYKTHNEIKRYSGIGVGGVLGLVIYLVVSPVTYFVIPSEVRQLYESNGRQSPVRGIYGLWVLLPLIGPIIWFVQVQGALNDLWRWVGAPGSGQAAAYGALPPPPSA